MAFPSPLAGEGAPGGEEEGCSEAADFGQVSPLPGRLRRPGPLPQGERVRKRTGVLPLPGRVRQPASLRKREGSHDPSRHTCRASCKPRGMPQHRDEGFGLPSLALRNGLRVALPGRPWPGVRQAARQCRAAPQFKDVTSPSLALRNGLRIARPGHPRPGVRQAARQCRASGLPHPTHTLALRNRRIHGESPSQPLGAQLKLTLRSVRSGCGMRIVARPSSVVRPVMPSGDPFGLSG